MIQPDLKHIFSVEKELEMEKVMDMNLFLM